MAYEELIEAEWLAAARLEETRPHLAQSRPGWCEGVRSTLPVRQLLRAVFGFLS